MGEYCPGDGNSYYCSDGTYVNSSLTGCNTCPKNHYCSWGEATPCPDGKQALLDHHLTVTVNEIFD